MEITTRRAKSILTPQRSGFLTGQPYPFTHTLSAYTGCSFGLTTCGLYCYAQFMPNWLTLYKAKAWGQAVQVKENAAELLARRLERMRPKKRGKLRIFMSSTTDPYQSVEAKYKITRDCLEVFCRYDDLDLLLIQTRAPLAKRDFDLMAQIPYLWLSVTIETDDSVALQALRGGPSATKRLALVREAHQLNIKSQIAVSPCLPYTADFVSKLIASGAERVIVDNFVAGDGANGKRTARTEYATLRPAWKESEPSQQLFHALQIAGVDVSWSAAGFCGIPPRE